MGSQTGVDREMTVAQGSLEQHTAASGGAESGTVATVPARTLVRYNPDAPSEEWGWHGSWRVFAPRGSNILLGLGIVLLFLQNFTIHESHVESFYYNGIALIGALYLVHRIRSGRKLRRRAAAAHGQQ